MQHPATLIADGTDALQLCNSTHRCQHCLTALPTTPGHPHKTTLKVFDKDLTRSALGVGLLLYLQNSQRPTTASIPSRNQNPRAVWVGRALRAPQPHPSMGRDPQVCTHSPICSLRTHRSGQHHSARAHSEGFPPDVQLRPKEGRFPTTQGKQGGPSASCTHPAIPAAVSGRMGLEWGPPAGEFGPTTGPRRAPLRQDTTQEAAGCKRARKEQKGKAAWGRGQQHSSSTVVPFPPKPPTLTAAPSNTSNPEETPRYDGQRQRRERSLPMRQVFI